MAKTKALPFAVGDFAVLDGITVQVIGRQAGTEYRICGPFGMQANVTFSDLVEVDNFARIEGYRSAEKAWRGAPPLVRTRIQSGVRPCDPVAPSMGCKD